MCVGARARNHLLAACATQTLVMGTVHVKRLVLAPRGEPNAPAPTAGRAIGANPRLVVTTTLVVGMVTALLTVGRIRASATAAIVVNPATTLPAATATLTVGTVTASLTAGHTRASATVATVVRHAAIRLAAIPHRPCIIATAMGRARLQELLTLVLVMMDGRHLLQIAMHATSHAQMQSQTNMRS